MGVQTEKSSETVSGTAETLCFSAIKTSYWAVSLRKYGVQIIKVKLGMWTCDTFFNSRNWGIPCYSKYCCFCTNTLLDRGLWVALILTSVTPDSTNARGHRSRTQQAGGNCQWILQFLTASGVTVSRRQCSRWDTVLLYVMNAAAIIYSFASPVKFPIVTHLLYWLHLHFKFKQEEHTMTDSSD